jgi:NAD(P)H-nitrite reductase large subunit
MSDTIIIVGASASGVSAAREIRKNNQDINIKLFSEENFLPYYRPYLTEYISNKEITKKSNFFLNPESWYAENRIDFYSGISVTEIIPDKKKVKCSDGSEHEYSKLILANGSRCFHPLPEAMLKNNVFSIKSISDADRVFACAENSKSVIIIGGGPLGLEAADSLLKKNISVTVIERASRILPRMLDAEGSSKYDSIMKGHGISLIYKASVESIEGGETATGVILSDSRKIEADMIIYSAGVVPDITLASNCGIKTGKGIIVNEKMETSIKDIFACGDSSEFSGRLNFFWMRAVRQGKTAGANVSGAVEIFSEEDSPALLNSFGTSVMSCGFIGDETSGIKFTDYKVFDEEKKIYKKLFFTDGQLAGAFIIGDAKLTGKIMQAIKNKVDYDSAVKIIS